MTRRVRAASLARRKACRPISTDGRSLPEQVTQGENLQVPMADSRRRGD